MALARITTWNPGDTLKAADLNGEFNNLLNNPITLISPTTGAINFNLQAHINLPVTAISASSAVSGTVPTVVASTIIWQAPFFTQVSVLSSTQTFNVGTGVTRIMVELWGAGGGGGGSTAGNSASGGGAGGYSMGIYTVTSSQSYSVTIGTGGAGGGLGLTGSSGGNSAFGTLSSALGGAGGSSGVASVSGGSASGGDLNIAGEAGHVASTPNLIGGKGGDSPRGGSGGVSGPAGTGGGLVPGGGGGGAPPGVSGGAGANGLCVVRF